MAFFLDLLYLLALVVLSPWLAYKALTTGKYRRGLGTRLRGTVPHRPQGEPCVWFHGVSVGEVHLLRQVVAAWRARHPQTRIVISSTTDTGLDEAARLFPDLTVFPWPFDFSWAVRRALRSIRPTLVVLGEGELWPNFLLAAEKAGIPVAAINARMSPRSGRRYARLGFLARGLLARVSLFAVQTEDHAASLRSLGVDPTRIAVTGSVKYDGAQSDRHHPRTQALRRLLGIQPHDLVWVAGSTQAPEESLALAAFARLRISFPSLKFILVPRQKDRFEDVADLVRRSGLPSVRRSQLTDSPTDAPLILCDTIGELGALWGLADIAFVGGSLDGRRGGQNMIEPAAYGAAVLFGPHIWNFREAATRLCDCNGAIQISDGGDLEATVHRLLVDANARANLGKAAQEFVQSQQGATARTIALLTPLVEGRVRQKAA